MREGEREGILLTEETHVASAVEEVLTEAQFLEQTPLGTEVSGYFLEDVPGQTLSAQDGSEYSARTAHLLVVEEAKQPEGVYPVRRDPGGGLVGRRPQHIPAAGRDRASVGRSTRDEFFHLLCGGGTLR